MPGVFTGTCAGTCAGAKLPGSLFIHLRSNKKYFTLPSTVKKRASNSNAHHAAQEIAGAQRHLARYEGGANASHENCRVTKPERTGT